MLMVIIDQHICRQLDGTDSCTTFGHFLMGEAQTTSPGERLRTEMVTSYGARWHHHTEASLFQNNLRRGTAKICRTEISSIWISFFLFGLYSALLIHIYEDDWTAGFCLCSSLGVQLINHFTTLSVNPLLVIVLLCNLGRYEPGVLSYGKCGGSQIIIQSCGFFHVLDDIGHNNCNSWSSALQTGSEQPPQERLCLAKPLGPLRKPSPSQTEVSKSDYMHVRFLAQPYKTLGSYKLLGN